MKSLERFNKLREIVTIVDDAILEKHYKTVPDAVDALITEGKLAFPDSLILDDALLSTELEYREKLPDNPDAYSIRRLYTSIPYLICIFLVCSMLVTAFVNVSSTYGFYATLIPFIVCIIARLVDKHYAGDIICKMNKRGIYINNEYIKCIEIPSVDPEFIRWKEVDTWSYKPIKSIKERFPVLLIHSKRYKDATLELSYFPLHGLKFVKLYCKETHK